MDTDELESIAEDYGVDIEDVEDDSEYYNA